MCPGQRRVQAYVCGCVVSRCGQIYLTNGKAWFPCRKAGERRGGGNTKGVTLALGHWADACRPVAFWQLPLREVESGGG